MVGESGYVFKKRVVFEKYISGIMYENPGGHPPSLSSPADVHDSKRVMTTIHLKGSVQCFSQ